MRPIGAPCVLLLALAVSQSLRLARTHAAEADFSVKGQVFLLTSNGESQAKDASRVAEWLVPQNAQASSANAPAKVYQMVQQDKRFEPDMLVVPVGSIVSFPNRDPWFHNVFSLYRGKRFDLGLYQAGDVKTVRFDRIGPSYIFCNIHPQMAAVILTVGSQYFGISDKSGHIEISNVPAGRYRLNVWYENADASALQSLARDVVVGDDRALPEVSINVVPHDLRNHKNKYGQDYDTGALSPSY
jgi:plastocyanin